MPSLQVCKHEGKSTYCTFAESRPRPCLKRATHIFLHGSFVVPLACTVSNNCLFAPFGSFAFFLLCVVCAFGTKRLLFVPSGSRRAKSLFGTRLVTIWRAPRCSAACSSISCVSYTALHFILVVAKDRISSNACQINPKLGGRSPCKRVPPPKPDSSPMMMCSVSSRSTRLGTVLSIYPWASSQRPTDSPPMICPASATYRNGRWMRKGGLWRWLGTSRSTRSPSSVGE